MSFPFNGFCITTVTMYVDDYLGNDAGFLSIKLSVKIDYDRWPELMMCDMESHGMQGLIHGTFKTLKENGDSKKKADESTVDSKRSDALVTVWIYASYGKDVMSSDVGIQTATLLTSVINELGVGSEVWMKKTAESYTIIAALMVTIVFAAAIVLRWIAKWKQFMKQNLC